MAELDSAYDSQGHLLEIAHEGRSYRLRRADGLQDSARLSDRVRQAHGRGKLLEIDLSVDEVEAILLQLRRRFRIVVKRRDQAKG